MHASISSSPFQRGPINPWTQNSNGSPQPAVGGSTYKTEAAKGAAGPHPLLSHLYRLKEVAADNRIAMALGTTV